MLLMFSSCTLMGIGYRYADWLIKRRILSVVKFYSPQVDRLEESLDDYMIWHKSTMLPRYQATIDGVAKRIETLKNREVSQEEVYQFLLTTRQLYLDSLLPLSVRVTPLLAELGEEQVDRTRTLITRKLDEVKEETKYSLEQVTRELHETWRENLEDWFGELSPEQLELIKESVPVTTPMVRFARGVQRMKLFMAIFEEIPLSEKEKREKALSEFFLSWSELKTYDEWRQQTAKFMSEFLKMISPTQVLKLKKKVQKWQKTIRDMQS